MTVSDQLILAELYLHAALNEASAAEVVIGVDQEEALRRIFHADRIAALAAEVSRRANFACDQNERDLT